MGARPNNRDGIAASLGASYLFNGLPLEVIATLAAGATVRRLSRNEALFEPGDPANEIFVVLSGQLKASVVNLDGDEVVHFVFDQAMTIGEPGYFARERDRTVRLTATAPAVVIGLHRRQLEKLFADHPFLKDRALERLAANARLQANMFAALATRPVADRLALKLLELAESNRPESPARTQRVSQSTLAAMVGVSRENANRALSSLVAQGLIRREGGAYVLVDEEGLKAMASRDFHPAQPRDIP